MTRFTDRSRSVLPGTLRPSRAIVITTALVAGLVTGCSSAPAAQQAPAATPTAASATTAAPATSATGPATAPATAATATVVVIKNFLFVPEALTVAAGATVTVDNQDGANHTVIANDGSFDTGNIAGRAKGRFTAPSKPGSYPYKCAIHPLMTGTLIVT